MPADSPYKSLKDLLADAKARPGELSFMSTGPLGPVHVAMAYLCKLAGVTMIHAPYSGEAPAIPDLLSKRIAVAVILESGAWGGKDAAPIARKMLDAWLLGQPQIASTADAGVAP